MGILILIEKRKHKIKGGEKKNLHLLFVFALMRQLSVI